MIFVKLSETAPFFDLVAQKFKETGERLTHQEVQQLLRERGLSAGNLYQEMEMDSAYVDAHEDISTSRDEVQLHSHTFYELIYCHSGSLDYLVGTQRYRLQRGDIVIIPPGISHRPLFLDLLTEPYRRMVLWISCNFAASFSRLFPIFQQKSDHYLVRTAGTQWESLEQYFRATVQEARQKELGWEAAMAAQTELLCVALSRARANLPPPQSEQRELLDEIMLYIEHHMTEKISLERAAQSFHVSESTISQLFRKRMDISFYHFVTQRRLIAAKNLIQTGASLEQAAADVGFGDYSNFYRAFRREYGITPASYRQLVRQ